MEVTRFEFATATRIVFGPGCLAEFGALTKGWGSRALLVTGQSPIRALHWLAQATGELVLAPFPVAGEPRIEDLREGIRRCRQEACDLVIGCGGGSAIDAGKAIAGLATHEGDPLDYLEVVGRGQALTRPGLPFVAIPTTAGTGAEVTRNAVIGSPEHRVKASLRSPYLLARLALIDPELTRSVPPAVTAFTGLDTLSQLLEPWVSVRANPMTDAFCREGLRRVGGALRRAWRDGQDRAARADMALASLWSGLALANAGLGAIHGIAGPLGGRIAAPHGALCAALLPATVAVNVQALRQRAPEGPALRRYEEAARLLTGNPEANADGLAVWLGALNDELGIPRLRHWSLSVEAWPELIANAQQASSMRGNPIALTPDELREILARA